MEDCNTVVDFLNVCKNTTADEQRKVSITKKGMMYTQMCYFFDVVQKSNENFCNEPKNKQKNKIKLT